MNCKANKKHSEIKATEKLQRNDNNESKLHSQRS